MHTDLVWEDGLVVEETLDPVHECVDVVGCRELSRSFVRHAVFPEIFVPGPCGHDRTLQDVERVLISTNTWNAGTIISQTSCGVQNSVTVP